LSRNYYCEKLLIIVTLFFSLEEMVRVVVERRVQRRERIERVLAEGWEPLPDPQVFHLRLLGTQSEYAQLINLNFSPLGLLLHYLPEAFVKHILDNIPAQIWIREQRSGGSTHVHNPTVKDIYQCLAMYIKMIGDQLPTAQMIGPHNIDAAGKYRERVDGIRNWLRMNTGIIPPGSSKSVCILANFQITSGDYYRTLSENFNTALIRLGAYAAGDEKLLHFTGKTCNIMKVISKPDRVGIWFYELAVRLPDNHGYLINIRVNDFNDLEGIHNPVHDVVQEWINALQEDVPFRPLDANLVLVFDNYYMSNATRNLVLGRNQKICASCKVNTFNDLSAVVAVEVANPGEHYALCNPNSGEIFVGVWDPDERIGKKFCLTNAYDWVVAPAPNNLSYLKEMIPGYDLYKTIFNLVDRVNYYIGNTKFPHKSGGKNHPGRKGHEHKFAMMCIMKNIQSAMNVLRPEEYPTLSSLCNHLSIELYTWASTLQ
jgi:hypothetical protein